MVYQEPVRNSIVTLLTDFGLEDAYVGLMKGVILGIAPALQVVDLTHAVAPQALIEGAFLLETAWRYFPAGTVHVAVVDPGVGTSRRRLALRVGDHTFVGPDNGLLSAALPDELRGQRSLGEDYEPRSVSLPDDAVAVSIENADLLPNQPSATFEGRDVFAPAAARLATGLPIERLGPRVDSIQALPAFRAPRGPQGIEGLVLRADHFGNLISDIRAADLPDSLVFSLAGRQMELVATYAAARGPSAIVGSAGFVEIAMPNGNAARVIGAGPGDRIVVT